MGIMDMLPIIARPACRCASGALALEVVSALQRPRLALPAFTGFRMRVDRIELLNCSLRIVRVVHVGEIHPRAGFSPE